MNETWLNYVEKVHSNKYDYSLVNYINAKTKVKIICPTHGVFEQTPDSHKKNGCPACGIISSHKTLTQEEFLQKMKKYTTLDFSQSKYINAKTKVIVSCLVCGNTFEKTPNSLDASGCPYCSNIKRKNTKLQKAEKAIQSILQECDISLLEPYTGLYDTNTWKRYRFECNKCNYQFVDFFDGQHKQLCPICYPSKISSKGELELRKYILDNFPKLTIVPNDRTILNGKEIDILIPSLSIGFEYDGIYWHRNSQEYDNQKDQLAKEKGITIYHIAEKRNKKDKLANFDLVNKIINEKIVLKNNSI